MKPQRTIKRMTQEYLDGEKRWRRAYQILMEISQAANEPQVKNNPEESHESSDLCESIHTTASTSADD